MATTDILPFAEGGSANVISQGTYAGLTSLLANGFTSGIAQSNQINKVLRQSTFMAAGLAAFCVAQGVSVPDDGNLSNLVTELETALATYVATLGRIRLGGNTNYYVSSSGNDSHVGSSGLPWLTIQHAISYIANSVDLNGFTATINVADGTYTAGASVSAPFSGEGAVYLKGDLTTPGNCVIQVTGGSCISVTNGGSLQLGGFKLKTVSSGDCIDVTGGTLYIVGNMDFDACPSFHMVAGNNGNILLESNYTITGSATGGHMYGQQNGNFGAGSLYGPGITAVTVSGTPAFGIFANAAICGTIDLPGITYSGSATGLYYNATINGAINTNGGGATYFPGSITGTVSAGGVYF